MRTLVVAPAIACAALAVAVSGAQAANAAAPGGRLLLEPSERRLHAAHGTWHRMFGEESLPTRFPVPFWVLALLVVGLIGLPYVWVAAQSLPDRGFALARPVGLLLVGWIVWWLGSLKLLAFTRWNIALALAIVGLGGLAIIARRRQEFAGWLSASRRLLLMEEAVFWLLFAGGVLVRWLNPDLWHPVRGGEKPMDFAFLNAVAKSHHFPPFDPWFADGKLNYYYFGFVLVAVLVKATSIAPQVAYNLAVPTLHAFLGAAIFTVTLGFVAPTRRAAAATLRRVPVVTALLGTAFVAVIGNLEEIKLVVRSINREIPADWWFWNATRVIRHPEAEPGTINEFPFFTFLFADLHAHAMALPYAAVALALGIAIIRNADGATGRAATAAGVGLLALVTGAFWATNTWDVPTYLFVGFVCLAAQQLARDRRPTLRGLIAVGAAGAVLVGLGYLLFLPFHLDYESSYAGFQRWRGSRTSVDDFLTIHGFFLFAIAAGLLVELARAGDANAVARLLRLAVRKPRSIPRLRQLHGALVTPSIGYAAGVAAIPVTVALVAVLAALGQGVAALAAATMLPAGLMLVRRRSRRADAIARALQQTAIVFVLTGLAITVLVEYLVVRNIDVGRQNTVFKFYLQVWVLWGVAAAVFVHGLYRRLPGFRRSTRIALRAGFVGLLAACSLYPIIATYARIDDRFDRSVGPTLDGLAFIDRAVLSEHDSTFALRYDGDAIRWFLTSVKGSPVVGELNTTPVLYGWGNRYARFTGNPAVIGWDYHERQQRPGQGDLVTERIDQIQHAYESTRAERAHRIFRRYGVRYFVVGPLERAYFPNGQSKWAVYAGVLWRPVYRNPGVIIYELLGAPAQAAR